jgi:predicted transposase YbfD/YdcC
MSAETPDISGIYDYLEGLTDPRVERTRLHALEDIIILALIAVVAGNDTWIEIEEFGQAYEPWLREFLPLTNGIPSHDTFGRVFRMLNSTELGERLNGWLQSVQRPGSDEHIAIDGKTLRRSMDKPGSKKALHVLNAWAVGSRIALGTIAAEDKDNEIKMIPKLLGLLELKGRLVSIDAIGCQKEVARLVSEAEGDYLLQVKDNQPALASEMRDFFLSSEAEGFVKEKWHTHEDTDGDHGRVETRRTWATEELDWFEDKGLWRGLKSIVIQRTTRFVTAEGKQSEGFRMFITSRPATEVAQLAQSARAHWTVENQLHWVLDVVFAEDQSRARRDNSALNLALLRRLALGLLKRDTRKVSMALRRKRASFDLAYLTRMLTGGKPG